MISRPSGPPERGEFTSEGHANDICDDDRCPCCNAAKALARRIEVALEHQLGNLLDAGDVPPGVAFRSVIAGAALAIGRSLERYSVDDSLDAIDVASELTEFIRVHYAKHPQAAS